MVVSKKGKIKKLVTAMILSFGLTSIFVASEPASAVVQNPFQDVDSSLGTHYNSIVTLYNQGIVKGVTNTEFKPNQLATRGEAALFLANALKLDTVNVTNPNFTDVPTTSPYYGAIAALYENQIIGGYGDIFKPDNTLSRAQIAKMITVGFKLNLATSTKTRFLDVNKLTDTSTKQYIQTLVNFDITTGTTSTTFSPNAKLKRGQLATFLYRALNSNTSNGQLEIITVE